MRGVNGNLFCRIEPDDLMWHDLGINYNKEFTKEQGKPKPQVDTRFHAQVDS